MLTLKDKINRILGNNVRLLLPSYWWKRVFGMVVDEVDRVEQKVNTKVDKSYVDKALSNVSTDENSLVFTLYTDIYGNVYESDEEIYQNELSTLTFLNKEDSDYKNLVLKWAVKENNKILYYTTLNPPLAGRGFNPLSYEGVCFYDVDFGDGVLGGVMGNKDVIFGTDGKATIMPHFGVNEANFIIAYHSSAGTLSSSQKEQNKRMYDILSKTRISQLPIFVYLQFNAGFTTIPVSVSKGAPEDSTAFVLQGLQHEFYIFVLQSDGNVTLLSNEPLVPSYDTSLSDTSTNAVQNKVIKAYIDEKVANVGGPEILELTFGETEEDRANNVKIYNKIVEAFNSDDINIPTISVEGRPVSSVELSSIEGETTAHLNFIADYISFKAIASLSVTKTGEVEVEKELEYSSYYFITSASSMVDFAKCVAAGLLPNVLYTDPRQGLVIADTFNSEGDNIVLYFNLSKGRTKVVVSSETGEILSEEVVGSGADSTFVIDLTVDEIEEALSNNGGVIDYTPNRELIIDALSKNIPMVVRIGEHSNGYCLAQGELDGADTLTITFNHSQYKYSILIGDERIEVDRRNVESFVTSTQLDSAIAQAITNTLNTEV